MEWTDRLRDLEAFEGERFFDEPLSKHTYFKIGGPARALVAPRSIDDLHLLRQFIVTEKIFFFFIGFGSNLLVSDEGFDGLFIKTSALPATIEIESNGIRVGAGVSVATFLRRAASEGWDGLERISGIPGTLGGVIAMNAGTHLGEAGGLLEEVRTLELDRPEGPIRVVRKPELRFGYRKNFFLKSNELVIDAVWRKTIGDPNVIREKLDSLYKRRKETQPLEFPSCGSVFKNPDGYRAWEVIDRLGLRGYRIGNAQFALKHPNWILNLGGAKAVDVLALIELAKNRARKELDIQLFEEVKIL